MRLNLILLAAIAFAHFGFTGYRKIPACYLNFHGTEKYQLTSEEKQSPRSTNFMEFSIAKEKKVKIHLIDSYEAAYKTVNEKASFDLSIELSENKKFKEYILAHYKLMHAHHKADHQGNLQLNQFIIDSVEVYGITSQSDSIPNFGNYAIFPNSKMAIYFRFSFNDNEQIKTAQDFESERDSIIRAYLKQVKHCEGK